MRKFFLLLQLFILLIPARAAADAESRRYYVLACPFTTLTDRISPEQLFRAAAGEADSDDEIAAVYLSPETADLFSGIFPRIPLTHVALEPLRMAGRSRGRSYCAVLPADALTPDLKVIGIGNSLFPWDHDYDPEADLLSLPSDSPNFDRSRVTTVLLTGTTALARTVAYKMSVNGPLYPAELLKPVFDSADITHISNESSIWSSCPKPRIDNRSLQFCSNENAYDLLDYLGVDVIELTGNHLRDYDWMPFEEMLDRFDAEGRLYYGAGHDPAAAAEPLFLTRNGNRFAFIGCNIAGPGHVFVDDGHPGVNRCDFDLLEDQIRELSDEGRLVIVTIQYYELYTRTPSEMQIRDFQRLSDAGAVIVSGSQAHLTQTMVPMKDRFIHYGIGNLFFDQMDIPVKGTRQELLDRYVFYDGRLLNVQLITALLTDYCRPRLMDDAERTLFLKTVFAEMRDD